MYVSSYPLVSPQFPKPCVLESSPNLIRVSVSQEDFSIATWSKPVWTTDICTRWGALSEGRSWSPPGCAGPSSGVQVFT